MLKHIEQNTINDTKWTKVEISAPHELFATQSNNIFLENYVY